MRSRQPAADAASPGGMAARPARATASQRRDTGRRRRTAPGIGSTPRFADGSRCAAPRTGCARAASCPRPLPACRGVSIRGRSPSAPLAWLPGFRELPRRRNDRGRLSARPHARESRRGAGSRVSPRTRGAGRRRRPAAGLFEALWRSGAATSAAPAAARRSGCRAAHVHRLSRPAWYRKARSAYSQYENCFSLRTH